MKLSVLVPMYPQSFKYFINIKPFKFLTALWEKFPWERWNEELNPEIIEKHCEVRIQMQIFWTQNNEFSKQERFRGRCSRVWHVLFYFSSVWWAFMLIFRQSRNTQKNVVVSKSQFLTETKLYALISHILFCRLDWTRPPNSSNL